MSSSPRRKKKGANDMNLWLTKEGMPTVLKHIKRQSTSVREMQIKTTLKSIFAVRLAWISSWSRLEGSKSYSYPDNGRGDESGRCSLERCWKQSLSTVRCIRCKVWKKSWGLLRVFGQGICCMGGVHRRSRLGGKKSRMQLNTLSIRYPLDIPVSNQADLQMWR